MRHEYQLQLQFSTTQPLTATVAPSQTSTMQCHTTPFTKGCPGANNKASPPGRHQEQAPKQRCTFRPNTFSSVQFSSGFARESWAVH